MGSNFFACRLRSLATGIIAFAFLGLRMTPTIFRPVVYVIGATFAIVMATTAVQAAAVGKGNWKAGKGKNGKENDFAEFAHF